jgi:hypothetical protein
MALSAASYFDTRGAPTRVMKYLMKASTTIYRGGLVMLNTSGTAEPAACGATSRRVVGVAAETKTSAASGTYLIEVHEGMFWLVGTTLGQDDVGQPVFVTDDSAIEETAPYGTIPAGLMLEYSSATKALILIQADQSVGREVIGRHSLGTIALSTIANGDLDTTWTPGFWGRILGFEARAVVVASTGGKTTTLNAEIGTTNVTGGTLELTTAGLATIGARMASAAIPTAANVFGPTDTVSVEAASTTAFSEGSAEIALKYAQFVF